MLSVIVPAYNEEKYLGETLAALQAALKPIENHEIIVVDNESTDRTPEIASGFGARIVEEQKHNISAVRNTGGKAATGEVLVFVDADTLVRPGLFEEILRVMADDICFGGSVAVEYGEVARVWVRWYLMLWIFGGRLFKMRHGAAQFSRREAFHELGGYDETIYMGEDIEFQWRLVKLARKNGGHTAFIEEPRVLTSARRYDKMGLWKTLFLTHPIIILFTWRTRSMWKDWYENAIR